ncbi:hypothetical protein ABZ478_14215 [Streptomyces sp. NPDC005706]|uniref:hypothetical protein n=1 Tax=Streptomyces sp. NPDC005706 TaxID=3157169 RepID=UPI00340B5F91
MTQESVVRQALARFDELPSDQATLLQALAVHQWFTAGLTAHTAADLGVGVTPEQVTASPFVVKDRVPLLGSAGGEQYGIRSVLRAALYDRMRTERPALYRQAHRIAVAYYHQPLEPLRTDRLTWYVHEIRHLAAFRPALATERLAAFSHGALVAGCAEAAGRAAAEVATASDATGDQELAGIIKAVAQILNAPAHVDHATVVLLNDLLTRYGTPANPAATRLVLLARDLVVHYTERPTPVTPLTALVAPDATAAVDPRGVPVLGGELRLLEDLAHPSRTIRTRVQRVELASSKVAVHHVTTRLATEDRTGRSLVLADVLPRNQWEQLDNLRLSERGTRPVDVLRAHEAARTLAQGLGRLVDAGEQASGASGRAELSRRLSSIGWYGGNDELTDLLQRTRQSDDVEEILRDRVADVMRYTPVVALLDVYPGLPSEVTYDYEEDCATRRDGLGRVVVSVSLTLPLQVRNRLQFVAPDGLVPAFAPDAEGVHLVPVQTGLSNSALQQFDVEVERPEEETAARIKVDLGYRLPDRDFKDATRTAQLCMVLSALALLLLVAGTTLVLVLGTVIASVVATVDVTRDGNHHDRAEPLHVYAGKHLRGIRRTNAVAAIAAAAAPNANSIAASLITSGAAVLYCLGTLMVVLSARKSAERPLSGSVRSPRRTLIG